METMNSYDASDDHQLWRQLQFGAGGGAGGIFLGNPEANNMTDMGNNGMEDESSGSPTATGIVIFLALSAAGIMGIVVATWGISYITDRLCCCCPWYQPVSNLSDFQANFDRGPVARKAHLWGLSVEDRLKILMAFFQKRVFLYEKSSTSLEEDKTKDEAPENATQQEDSDDVTKEEETTDKASNEEKDPNMQPSAETSKVAENEKNGDPIDIESGNSPDVEHEEKDEDGAKEKTETNEDDELEGDAAANEKETDAADTELNKDKEEAGMDDADHERICCICLNEYEQGDKLMTGTQCIHKLHFDCCMEWMRKHDHCPYCREEMLTPSHMREQAIETLGEAKVKAFGSGAAPPVTEATTVQVPPPQPTTETSPTNEAEEAVTAESDQVNGENDEVHDEENPPIVADQEKEKAADAQSEQIEESQPVDEETGEVKGKREDLESTDDA